MLLIPLLPLMPLHETPAARVFGLTVPPGCFLGWCGHLGQWALLK